jgi:polysaccharide biosynthesis/export protein
MMNRIQRLAAVILATVVLLGGWWSPGLVADEYVIGIDDLLQIQVWDNKELDQTVPVRPDGKISFPLVGEIAAAGLTVTQLQRTLTEQLEKSIKQPNVSVIVKEIRSFRVYVMGRVLKPGVHPIKAGTPLLQALTLAGGVTDGADLGAAYVVRGSERIPVDLRRLLQQADLSQNIPLRTDDTVVVPEVAGKGGDKDKTADNNSVFVMGEVAKPGSYPRTEALTLMKLVSLAGGFTRFAAPGRITLLRETPGVADASGGKEKTRIRVDFNAIQRDPKQNPDVSLQAGDVIVVPQTHF